MNVLLLSQFFSLTKGGGEYVFSLVAKSLAEEGNNVWVITNKIKNEEYQTHKNIKIIFVPPVLEYSGGLPTGFYQNLRYAICAVFKGISIVKNEKIDVIHSNNFAPALAGSILSVLTGKPHITTIHDVFSLCGKQYWKLWGKQNDVSKISVFLAPFFEKLILKLKHKAIHTVSDTTKQDLIKFGATKPIHVIPNGIEIKDPKNIEVKPFQFIYIGRLVFYKNIEVAIKAISIVKKKFPEISLTIVGDGPHRKNLERLVSDLSVQQNVKFEGYVSDQEKEKLLASSQALVFPSLCEGFGIVVLEAFSQKKPVLVSDIHPLSDIVTNDVTGFVLSPYDENQWAKALTDIIENSQKSQNMGNMARKELEKTFGFKNMKQEILKMYSEII